jgi:hypothetical protein
LQTGQTKNEYDAARRLSSLRKHRLSSLNQSQ